jgi:hypothetical protein
MKVTALKLYDHDQRFPVGKRLNVSLEDGDDGD